MERPNGLSKAEAPLLLKEKGKMEKGSSVPREKETGREDFSLNIF
jgi:hypothetical protein